MIPNTRGKTSTDGIKHMLRGIDVIRADNPMTSKVLANGGSVRTDVPEIGLRK